MKKHDLISLYGLPDSVKFCKLCTVSNQRPRITFDDEGICSACRYAEYKKTKVDWGAREKELLELCDKHRKNNGEYDVIVPCSGGKDGSFVAHQLKYKYGMNPLAVTWAPLRATSIGRKNLDSFINAGFNHILGTPNPLVTKKLCYLAFKHLGDPFQPFIYGQYNFPLHMAVKNNVKLVMYGENGEVEYGGNMKTAYTPTRPIEDQDGMYFSGLPPEFWLEHGVSDADLYPFKPPKYDDLKRNSTEVHFFGYYKCWDPQENYYYCREHAGFTPNSERTDGTYSKYASIDDQIDGFHYYLSYIKFGIGRATSDSAHEIRDGKITREEGVALVKKYDHEFPNRYYDVFKEYCNVSDLEVNELIDSWRSSHIWSHDVDGWKLRHAVWHEEQKDE
jgi:N-acetyl sugar amidotransferase